MKRIIYIVILFLITNCNDNINSSEELFFDPENLSKLSIENLSNFWVTDSIFIDNYTGFSMYDGYLSGVEYRNYSVGQNIAIYVFESKQVAIENMQEYL